MALNHGFDAAGQNVVILCIAKHRKNSKKAEMIRKWIAFCYEMHVSWKLVAMGVLFGVSATPTSCLFVFLPHAAKCVPQQQDVHGV